MCVCSQTDAGQMVVSLQMEQACAVVKRKTRENT